MNAINNTGFKDIMYVYAVETAYKPSSLKVAIPDALLDKGVSSSTTSLFKTVDIFINNISPIVSSKVTSKGYLELPVISSAINSMSVSSGDRLIASFINSNPNNGIILGR